MLRHHAEGGSADALHQLAAALVARHQHEEALALHRRAADAGHERSQVEYARMLMYGIATAADPQLAAQWLLRAEAAGNPVASYLLVVLALGDGGVHDARFNQRLLAAVQANYPPAVRAAAIHFGRKASAADQVRCLQLLERGAGLGDAVCARLLAERLLHGEGCTPQPEAAREILQQLARHGIGPLPALAVPQLHAPDTLEGALALDEVLRPATAQPRCERPRVMTIDGLLSADECRLLIACAEPNLARSRTVDPRTGQPQSLEIRTSEDASFDPILEDLALRLVQIRMATAARMPLANAEHLTVLRYRPGQEYRPHRDYRPPGSLELDQPQAGNRQRTICVYLNEVEAGGETEFPLPGLRIAPSPGRAVIFENLLPDGRPDVDSLHAGLPVERGEKWLATLWLRQGRYRAY
ncbi:2OG-Fe(II) oxygenase [Lysobacter terrestris]|uniref:2OG-Fe(II) oxygenase n=2 Tax=Agrilutibacter terrestris TaxID=2865112 RepID=A0A7H0G1R9_9GAMM|nr:2OG-Fe(II) oxygenase [Lysobacter terrestris]